MLQFLFALVIGSSAVSQTDCETCASGLFVDGDCSDVDGFTFESEQSAIRVQFPTQEVCSCIPADEPDMCASSCSSAAACFDAGCASRDVATGEWGGAFSACNAAGTSCDTCYPESSCLTDATEVTTAEPMDGTTAEPMDGTTAEPMDGTTAEPMYGTTAEPGGGGSSNSSSNSSSSNSSNSNSSSSSSSRRLRRMVSYNTLNHRKLLASEDKFTIQCTLGVCPGSAKTEFTTCQTTEEEDKDVQAACQACDVSFQAGHGSLSACNTPANFCTVADGEEVVKVKQVEVKAKLAFTAELTSTQETSVVTSYCDDVETASKAQFGANVEGVVCEINKVTSRRRLLASFEYDLTAKVNIYQPDDGSVVVSENAISSIGTTVEASVKSNPDIVAANGGVEPTATVTTADLGDIQIVQPIPETDATTTDAPSEFTAAVEDFSGSPKATTLYLSVILSAAFLLW